MEPALQEMLLAPGVEVQMLASSKTPLMDELSMAEREFRVAVTAEHFQYINELLWHRKISHLLQ
jgi:hypothetical protein